MNWFRRTSASDFRGKHINRPYIISVSMWMMMMMLIVFVMLMGPAHSLPTASTTGDDQAYEGFEVNDEYPEVDNVEWHHVKMVDGGFQGDHPVIMYKEDFVSEDFDPNKNISKADTPNTESSSAPAAKLKRKYKDIAGHRRRHMNRTDTEKYNAVKPEKMLFDVLPLEPVMGSDDSAMNDSKFDPSQIRVEVIPLTDDDEHDAAKYSTQQIENETPNKDELLKRPKKYHHRQRRNTHDNVHVVQKRNPYYDFKPATGLNGLQPASVVPLQSSTGYSYKQPVSGKFWNGLYSPVQPHVDFQNRFGNDESIVWPISRRTQQATPQRRPQVPVTQSPPSSIFHDSRPENADTSFINRQTTRRPIVSDPSSIFHDSRPENADTSFLNRQPSTIDRLRPTSSPDFQGIFQVPVTSTTRRPTPTTPANSHGISDCVWAIVNCCQSSDTQIRYTCFERNGCTGAFWDLNPCADNIRDPIVQYVNEVYN